MTIPVNIFNTYQTAPSTVYYKTIFVLYNTGRMLQEKTGCFAGYCFLSGNSNSFLYKNPIENSQLFV